MSLTSDGLTASSDAEQYRTDRARSARAGLEGRSRIGAAIIGGLAVLLAPVIGYVLHAATQDHAGHAASPTTGQPGYAITYDHLVLHDHPTAFYTFDDAPSSATTFHDATGHGYEATAIGRSEVVHPGPFGANDAGIEVGPGGYVQTPSLNPLIGDSARTVELWFRLGRLQVSQCVFSSGSQSPGASFSICVTNGDQYASPRPGSPGIYLQIYSADLYVPEPTPFDANWHYLAVTLNGSRVTIDVDGVTPANGYTWNGRRYSSPLPQPFVLPSRPNTTLTAANIGGPGWMPGADGNIDDVAVYGSAISVSDLKLHYAAGASLFR